MPKSRYFDILQRSKFCLAPCGMGFSTRVYESIAQVSIVTALANDARRLMTHHGPTMGLHADAQGCVPLIIMDEPDSQTDVEQAFEDVLPYANFSLRLKQTDIPNLAQILGDFPNATWLQLRRNLAC
eukprot:369116-Prymnesium_polylepis.1